MAAHEITNLLRSWGSGDGAVVDRLFTLLYDELRIIARRQLRGRHGRTLNTTAIVHEAYVKLLDPSGWCGGGTLKVDPPCTIARLWRQR